MAIAARTPRGSPGSAARRKPAARAAGLRAAAGRLGNRALGRLLRAKLPPRLQRQKGAAANLDLPWKDRGVSLFEVTRGGVRVLAGVEESGEKAIRAAIPAIAARIAADNKLIQDPAHQVKLCLIVPGTTRFAFLHGVPVLLLDPADATEATAAHEMGHALFDYFQARSLSKASDAAAAGDFRLRMADIYRRLDATRLAKGTDSTGKEIDKPVGHWMVDPSWWAGGKAEHPWEDPDEFFASAKAAYQTDRAALKRAMDRAVKADTAVEKPAKELLALLDDLLRSGKLSAKALPAAERKQAEQALARVTGVSKVEDSLKGRDIGASRNLRWLIDPASRPLPEAAEPVIEAPGAARERPQHPNLVTGPGGVVEQMEKRFRERLREKILDSAEDLP